ncbi:probable pilus assembly protein [Fulvimarina pelagi HTCC2506]|uniref:Probable pilus assembly protein n=1 Tax=Fulvimarina pelagi HTCC2506 TaxID=314231 RepID=Q0G4Q8_9HYPH|nr:type II secretion system F family protein [Fulvimarina pelagi]EAU43356.1 probable pilus assembly protein [Fulvimarina pelagi HTCC2506]
MTPFGMMLFVLLSTISAGCLAYAFMQPKLAASKRVAARKTTYSRDEASRTRVIEAKERMQEQAKRRRALQNNLKDLEDRAKERGGHSAKPTLQQRIDQAGLKITAKKFRLISAGLAAAAFLLTLVFGLPILATLGIAVVAGLGLPRAFLSNRRKKRINDFSNSFPTAIDLIVRGVKAGLPLNDTLRTVVSDVPDPVSSEFQKVVEAQQMGVTLGDACDRLYKQVPLPETNFFAIVIAIQSQAGGNLSEALGNLSRVLRERKKMRQKIQAVSMEAKASASIIGSIPVLVASMIYMTSPDYLNVLLHDPRGNIVLIASAVWMLIGVLIMKKMINFDI